MLIFGVMAVMLRSMLKSAIALAAASVALGIIMYELSSPWAALFEISVCSGLVTVIFISAISLSNTDKKDLEKLYEDKKRMAFLPAILIISGVALVAFAMSSGFSMPEISPAAEAADNFREILWNHRQADIWGQIIVIITGAIAVTVLFRERV
jgi:NADH-quinone oxidoreductase subunit J